ncbi:MAG: hypothetical protein GXO16_08325 [Epsilonproteobacteria bacterium]|nr:hypothetical protein [Campylobacterota bacterium]
MNLPLIALGGMALLGAYIGLKRKDPNINVSDCFFDHLAVPLYSLFREFDSNKGIIIDDVGEDFVVVNTPQGKLYGIELIGGDNVPNYLRLEDIERLVRTYKRESDAFFVHAILKQGFYHKQYIFSHNRNMLLAVGAKYNLKLMRGIDIVNAIFDLFLENSYYIEDKTVKRTMGIYPNGSTTETGDELFRKLARNAIYNGLRELDVWQAYKSLPIDVAKIQEVFKLDFEGVVWNYVDFNQKRIELAISRLLTAASWTGNKEAFKALKQAYSDRKIDLAIINSVAVLKEYDESIIGSLGSNLKTAYVRKDLYRKDVIRKTPIKWRDAEFDFLVDIEWLDNYFSPIHKKLTPNPDIWGYDHVGAFVNYSFSGDNDNPHSVIIARTGSGKTVAKQKIISQMIDVDFATGEARKLGKEVKVRNYDVGYSDEKFVSLLASNDKNDVAIVESDFDDFSYNLVNIETDENGRLIEADLQFASDLVSVILESQGSAPLTIGEQAAFKEAVRKIYATRQFKDRRVRDLRIRNKKLYEKLLAEGYDRNAHLSTVEGYDFLKKPLLADVIAYANVEAQNKQIKENQRKAYEGLAVKLTDIDNLELFSYFDSIDIKNSDFISMELNNFKESPLFTPIFLCIFQKVYLNDRKVALECKRKGIPAPKLLYPIEEAKNFFRIPYFETLLEKLALEARKYNVHLFFVVQNADHIPVGILKNLDTKIFLLRQDKKSDIINEVREHFDPPKKVLECLDDTQQYELCIWYAGGVFNLNFEMTDEEEKLYNTNPNKV